MLDLSNCTFIIPCRIESADRAWNFEYTVGYLCRNLKTNIFIFESGPKQFALDILRRIPSYETKISYRYEYCEDAIFHRTRLLNEMLADVQTKCVVNYDADVFLEPATYLQAYNEIISGESDFCYPYFRGLSQKQVFRPKMTDDLTQEIKHVLNQSDCGHCFFASTEKYIEAGMENETSFISYAPEDAERAHRFITLGYKVKWLDDRYVWHIEHSRGINSGRENPHFENNNKEFERLKALPAGALREYYNNASYLKKYKKKMITLLTYSDEKYRRQQEQLTELAIKLNTADYFISYTKEELIKTDFYSKNKELLEGKRAGWFVWKPFIILEALKTLSEDDILVYMDCGDVITRSFREFVQREMRTKDILLTQGSFPNWQYTRRDTFVIMEMDEPEHWNDIQVEAGIIVCKNTPEVIKLFTEWLNWCLIPQVIMSTQNTCGKPNIDGFVEHRWDQSVLSLLKYKYNIPTSNGIRTFITCNAND